MVITSENKPKLPAYHKSSMFRYAAVYIVVTFVVLLFLNIYCSNFSQQLFYNNKKTAMIERCLMVASEITELEILNKNNVSAAISQLDGLNYSRVIITDEQCIALYDSASQTTDKYILLPEVLQAMPGNNVFQWTYHDGAMTSIAAVPMYSYGTLIGCVYISEYDTTQGALIQNLQNNIFIISVILETAVILFAFFFSVLYNRRLRRITASIRTIQEGDYSHKVLMGGDDELTGLADAFNALIEKLQTSEQKRSQFVSDASHELKTPLASIKLLTDSILQNKMDAETIREFVGDIGNEADRLTRMTQKLLTLSKIESMDDGDCEIVYIGPTVEKVARMLSGLAQKQAVEIQLDLSADRPILIMEDDLYQIVFNLVENGIKYNTSGGTLSISLSQQEDNAVLNIRDTGVGIPEDALSHIFERFYRVDKARSRKTGGSGLGLSIVRNMVERNRGELHVTSEVGKGTTFTVSFPVFETEVDK